MKKSLAILIYAHNDEKNIKDCIESARLLSKDIHLIDIESSDDTVKIAGDLDVNVHKLNFAKYVELVRETGINLVNSDWIFILDADERITEKMAEEIKNSIKNNQITHYSIPRKNIFDGVKWLKYGGWWPDLQIRLINKISFINWPKEIHSAPYIKGISGNLKNPIVHSFHGNIEKMVEKTLIFEDIESNLLFRADKNATTLTFFRKFCGELFRRLFKNLGFLDGPVGIIESIYQAFSKTITYLLLYEKKNSRTLRSLS